MNENQFLILLQSPEGIACGSLSSSINVAGSLLYKSSSSVLSAWIGACNVISRGWGHHGDFHCDVLFIVRVLTTVNPRFTGLRVTVFSIHRAIFPSPKGPVNRGPTTIVEELTVIKLIRLDLIIMNNIIIMTIEYETPSKSSTAR